jgi:hypothetical protein
VKKLIIFTICLLLPATSLFGCNNEGRVSQTLIDVTVQCVSTDTQAKTLPGAIQSITTQETAIAQENASIIQNQGDGTGSNTPGNSSVPDVQGDGIGTEEWALFSPGEIGGRRKPYPSYELEASDDYGFLYPFAVPYGATIKHDWDESLGAIETQPVNLFGLVDATGRIVIDPIYTSIQMLQFYDFDTSEYMPTNTYLMYEMNTERAGQLNNTVMAACDGSWVISKEYAYGSAGADGIIVYKYNEQNNGEYRESQGLISYEGEVLIPCGAVDIIRQTGEGLAAVANRREDGTEEYFYTDLTGKTVIPPGNYTTTNEFSEGLAAVFDSSASLYGYIGVDGEYVIKPRFSGCRNFKNGYAVAFLQVYENSTGVIDRSGNNVIPFEYDNIRLKHGIYTCEVYGEEQRKTRYFRISDRGAAIELNRRDLPYSGAGDGPNATHWVFGLGYETELGIPGVYGEPIPNGAVIVTDHNINPWKSGIIKTDGTWLLPMESGRISMYSYLRSFSGLSGTEYIYCEEYKSRRISVLNLYGQVLFPAKYDQICAVGDMFSVIQGRYSGIIDKDGNWLFRKSLLDYISD